MKAALGALAAIAIGAGAYFVFSGPSSEAQVQALLEDEFGDVATIDLQACDLRVTSKTTVEIGLVEIDLRVDLQMYDFQTVRIVPATDGATYVASREQATNAMIDQVRAVFAAAGEETLALLPDEDGMRDVLNDPAGTLFMRLMALVETDTEGNAQLMAHEDGPMVFGHIQAVQQLPAPVSYMTTASYVGDTASADGLRTGEINAVPQLNLTFKNNSAAQEFGQAMYEHAAYNCP